VHTLHTNFVVSAEEAVHIEVCEQREAKRLLDAQLKTQCRVAKADEQHKDHCVLNPVMDKLTEVGL